MQAGAYWDRVLRRRVARRQAIIAGGATGLGAMFLAACGSGNNNSSKTSGSSAQSGASAGSGSSGAASPSGGSGSAQSSLVSKPVDTSSSAKRGGVLNLQGGEPNSFDFTAGSGAPTFSGHVYSRLLKYKTFKYPDPAVASPEPDAATSWETSPDGLTYTYKVRQGMKFDPRPPTNGRELTAQDVVFSWNRFAKLSSFRTEMVNSADPSAPVASVTAPDASTVVVKLAFPFGPFNINFGYYRYGQIMPAESDGGFDPKSDARGSGVWRLKAYTPSVGYEYERNPDWYDANNVNLDGIAYAILPEYTTILAQFESGRLGTYDKIQAQDILPAKQSHSKLVLQAGDTFPTASPWIRMSYLPDSPFRDERVRQALSMLIERDLYVSTFGNVDKFKAQGLEVPTRWNTVIPAGMDPYWLDPKNQTSFGAGAKYFQYSPDEAKKLVSAAGFSGAIPAKFTYSTLEVPEKVATLQQMWETGGAFKITANVVDFVTEFRPNYSQSADKFDGIAYSGASGYPDVDGWLSVYDRDGSPRAGHVGADGQPDAQLNQLIAAQRAEPDQQKRISILQDLQRYAASKMYMLLEPGAATTFSLAWPWLGNFGVFRSQQDSLQPVEGWTHYWIDQSKA